MNLFASSAEFLHGSLSQVAGRVARYVRVAGAEEWPITAPVSQRQYPVVEENDVITLVTAYDWIIPVADLPIKPQSGDEVHDGCKKFVVCALRPLPPAHHMDSDGVLWVVHSKLVEDEDE